MLSDRLGVSIAPSLARHRRGYRLGDQSTKVRSSVSTDKEIKVTEPMIGGHLPSSCSLDDRKKLSLSLDVLVNYAKLFGFRSDSFVRSSTLSHWHLCSAEIGWVKFLKYKLAAFMAFHLDNPLPEKPFPYDDIPSQLAGGSLGRFIRSLDDPDQSLSFAVGILYSKKGMPRPDDLALEQAKVKTKIVLTTKQPLRTSPFSSTAVIAEEVRRTCREVFSVRITDKDIYHPYAPSVKANYIDTRSKFGTFGTLMDERFLMDRVAPQFSIEEFRSAFVIDSNSDEIEDEETAHIKISPGFKSKVTQIYREVFDNVRSRAMDEEANVKLVALPEALKVRVISKGPPLTYFTLKPVQKFLHSQMRKLRCFRLIGETVTPNFLSEVFSGKSGTFHSLDYQSATDLLDPVLSACCVDGICDAVGMPDDLRVLFHKALTGHLIEDVPQVWGQLMGSVVSFIILCVVNMSVIRQAFEIETNTRVSVVDIPAIVNGDDGLVRCSSGFSSVWESIASVAGLIPSLGKVYTDDEYVNINSTSYLVEGESFRLIPYVNMGLVMGLGRSGSAKVTSEVGIADDYSPYLKSLGARHHQLIESCPPDLILEVHELFLQHNAESLKSVRVPWYIPESLGGIGLKPLIRKLYSLAEDLDNSSVKMEYLVTSTGHVCGPSRLDVVIAETFASRGYKTYSVKRIPSSQPIQSRLVWLRALRGMFPSSVHVLMSEADESFMDLAAYYISPSLVAKELEATHRVAAIRRNERAWQSILSQFTDSSLYRGESLFLDSSLWLRNSKDKGVKPLRLVGADKLTSRPIYRNT
jgi:hypothetical protein